MADAMDAVHEAELDYPFVLNEEGFKKMGGGKTARVGFQNKKKTTGVGERKRKTRKRKLGRKRRGDCEERAARA